MKIVFDSRANDDLDHVFAHIARDSPTAAYGMIERLRAQIRRLLVPGFDQMGRGGLIAGTRELIEHPYIVVYRVTGDGREIVILAVLHGAQQR